jgi:hypothetical protein
MISFIKKYVFLIASVILLILFAVLSGKLQINQKIGMLVGIILLSFLHSFRKKIY